MSNLNGLQAELLTLCGFVRDGTLTPERFARLETLLRDSPEARELYVQFVQLNAYLMRQGGAVSSTATGGDDRSTTRPTPADAAASGPASDTGILARLHALGFEFPDSGAPSALSSSLDSRLDMQSPIDGDSQTKPPATARRTRGGDSGRGLPIVESLAHTWRSARDFLARPLPLAASVAILTVLAVLTVQRMTKVQAPTALVAKQPHGEPPYVATLVNVTNCRWDKARSTADLQRQASLRAGESLHLLEGVAEINSVLPGGGAATIQLEGPLAMMLTSEGMPSLLYGRLSGLFSCDFDQFTLDTPLGRVLVSGDASIGVTAAANDVELHVFNGVATFELWAMGLSSAPEQVKAAAGSSLRVRVVSEGRISVDRGTSRENWFVTPAALAASRLPISEQYVAAIRAAQPIAYWRFEGEVDGLVRNEMADRFHCRMVGDAVRLRTGQGNRSAEFGLTPGPGYLISDDTLDGAIDANYTMEAWVKPTYYHHGALFSLIEWSPTESPLGRHRLHVELCGPVSGYPTSSRPSEFHPGRIRFMHQNTDSFSSSPYAVRKWQHLVAVKDNSNMRLYADGRLVAKAEDARTLGSGLRVLMGQLFPRSPHLNDEVTSRLFVGELDEVALYDRALGDDEIQRHVKLGLPAADAAAEAHNQQDY